MLVSPEIKALQMLWACGCESITQPTASYIKMAAHPWCNRFPLTRSPCVCNIPLEFSPSSDLQVSQSGTPQNSLVYELAAPGERNYFSDSLKRTISLWSTLTGRQSQEINPTAHAQLSPWGAAKASHAPYQES